MKPPTTHRSIELCDQNRCRGLVPPQRQHAGRPFSQPIPSSPRSLPAGRPRSHAASPPRIGPQQRHTPRHGLHVEHWPRKRATPPRWPSPTVRPVPPVQACQLRHGIPPLRAAAGRQAVNRRAETDQRVQQTGENRGSLSASEVIGSSHAGCMCKHDKNNRGLPSRLCRIIVYDEPMAAELISYAFEITWRPVGDSNPCYRRERTARLSINVHSCRHNPLI